MNTLLLRISGPMQSWGVQSHFSIRDTGLEPSKSGVVGLVCASMGVSRDDDQALARLSALQMGVRVDQEGHMSRDYHTALKVIKAGGGFKETDPSTRYYLADAAFLVGLQGEDLDLLESIHAALKKPVWPLFLGRKAFVPGVQVYLPDGLKPGTGLYAALQEYSYLGRESLPIRVRLVLEDPQGYLVRQDQPVSFRMGARQFIPRRVHNTAILLMAASQEVP